jgi:Rad3-related DNA helicase
MVYWLRPAQNRPGGNRNQPQARAPHDEWPALLGAPAAAGPLIQRPLRQYEGGVVLAGTALAVEGHFSESAEALGLATTAPATAMSVDYSRQTLLLTPADAPEPNMPAFQRGLTETLSQVAGALGGRTVVLFASHTALRTTYAAVKPLLESQDIMALAQGIDGSLRQLWQNYRSQQRVVLLGAGGMWDGWEAEGAQAGCIFIPRLPLAALSDPLLATRAAAFHDPMRQFLVPQAALKLRLALNRLAWEHAARNVVVLYDTRLQTKDYGATILNTLPPMTQRSESATMLGAYAREWLDGQGA